MGATSGSMPAPMAAPHSTSCCPSPMAERAARRQVVAIVDDDPSIRSALDRLIRALGYEALAFAGAEPLLARLDEADIAFVVTDVQMPGVSGLELLKILAERRPHLPVMVM